MKFNKFFYIYSLIFLGFTNLAFAHKGLGNLSSVFEQAVQPSELTARLAIIALVATISYVGLIASGIFSSKNDGDTKKRPAIAAAIAIGYLVNFGISNYLFNLEIFIPAIVAHLALLAFAGGLYYWSHHSSMTENTPQSFLRLLRGLALAFLGIALYAISVAEVGRFDLQEVTGTAVIAFGGVLLMALGSFTFISGLYKDVKAIWDEGLGGDSDGGSSGSSSSSSGKASKKSEKAKEKLAQTLAELSKAEHNTLEDLVDIKKRLDLFCNSFLDHYEELTGIVNKKKGWLRKSNPNDKELDNYIVLLNQLNTMLVKEIQLLNKMNSTGELIDDKIKRNNINLKDSLEVLDSYVKKQEHYYGFNRSKESAFKKPGDINHFNEVDSKVDIRDTTLVSNYQAVIPQLKTIVQHIIGFTTGTDGLIVKINNFIGVLYRYKPGKVTKYADFDEVKTKIVDLENIYTSVHAELDDSRTDTVMSKLNEIIAELTKYDNIIHTNGLNLDDAKKIGQSLNAITKPIVNGPHIDQAEQERASKVLKNIKKVRDEFDNASLTNEQAFRNTIRYFDSRGGPESLEKFTVKLASSPTYSNIYKGTLLSASDSIQNYYNQVTHRALSPTPSAIDDYANEVKRILDKLYEEIEKNKAEVRKV